MVATFFRCPETSGTHILLAPIPGFFARNTRAFVRVRPRCAPEISEKNPGSRCHCSVFPRPAAIHHPDAPPDRGLRNPAGPQISDLEWLEAVPPVPLHPPRKHACAQAAVGNTALPRNIFLPALP